MFRLVILFLGLTLFFSQGVLAQGVGPVLDPAYGLDSYVTGQASADAGRLVVYDTFYPANTKLGEGVVEATGKFGISTKLPLQEGHALIVQDSLLRVSPLLIVFPPRTGTAAAKP